MKKLLAIVAIAVFAISFTSCKSKVKDEDVKTAVQTVLTANPDYNMLAVDVKDGVATITGEVKDETTRAGINASLKEVKGVKEVVNSATVTPPPPPPVVINPDDALTTAVKDALKDHTNVTATVADGVVTLTGTVKNQDEKRTVQQKISALKPKSIANNVTIK